MTKSCSDPGAHPGVALLTARTLTGATALVRPARASAAATVAGQEPAAIAANPSFVFATDLAGTVGAGEASPIDTAYWLGVHEVTNAQYLDFVTGTGQDTPPTGTTSPAPRTKLPS